MPDTNGHGPKRVILCTRVSPDERARSGYSLSPTDRSRPLSNNSRRLVSSAGQKGSTDTTVAVAKGRR